MLKYLPFFLLYAVALSAVLASRGFRGTAAPLAAPGDPAGKRRTRLLIVGATGATGRQLVAQALERGYEVTALVRETSRLPVYHPKLRVVEVDVLDYAAVEEVVRGQEAVVSALGHKRFLGPTRILSEGTRNLLRAMKAHGVGRFVCVTTLGIGDSAGRMGIYYTFFVIPLIVPFYFWDKTRQERLIAASDAEWVIVRPGRLTNGTKRGACRHGPGVGSFLATVRVSRADVADFMLDQVESDAYLRQAPGVARG